MPAVTRDRSVRTGIGRANGTCGELLQGVLPDGRAFHVSCPIDLVSEIAVRIRPAPAVTVTGLSDDARTTRRAIGIAAELLELGAVEIAVTRQTALPAAKGMASSTADVIAATRALAAASGQTVDAAALARLACSIEASDAVMYDGIVAAHQHTGALLRQWEWWPRYSIAMFVPLASRVTAETSFSGQHRLAGTYAELLDQVDGAMRDRDARGVAIAATHSAQLNEAFAPNQLFAALQPRAAQEAGALGLCVGHSGTVCGLLFDASPEGTHRAERAVRDLLPQLPAGTVAQVTKTPR